MTSTPSDPTSHDPTSHAGSTSRDDRAAAAADELHAQHPEFDEIPELEVDENVAPRPEEAIADVGRQERQV